jgi:hypothetical protein
MSIVAAASILGMVLGTAGFIMSLLNYLRDRPCVRVQLEWDTKTLDLLNSLAPFMSQTQDDGRYLLLMWRLSFHPVVLSATFDLMPRAKVNESAKAIHP